MSEHIRASGKTLTEQEQFARVIKDFEAIQIITLGNEDIGMTKVARGKNHWKLIQIQLLPTFQNAGLGTKVMNELIKEASFNGKALDLTVLKVNPAKRLYDRLGFYVVEEKDSSYDMRRDA